jgi:hypothetical protein
MSFNFEIPKIFKSIHLSDYAPEFGEEAVIEVWVNFPKAIGMEHDSIFVSFKAALDELKTAKDEKEPDQKHIDAIKKHIVELNEDIESWYGKVWHQNGEPLTQEDVIALFAQAEETDPMLMNWLIKRTFELINEHREALKN